MAHRILAALGRRRMTRRGFLVRAVRASLGVSALGLVGVPIGARAQNDVEPAPDAAASLADRHILLRRGFNEVAWTGPPTPVEALVANSGNGLITTVYHRRTALNELTQTYRNPAFFPGLPAILVEAFVVQPGDGLGLTVAWDTPWPQPLLAPPPAPLREDNLDNSFTNRASWLGPDATPIAQALQGLQSSFGGIGKVVAWFFDRRAQEWLVYRSEGPAFFNTLAELHYGDAVNLTIDLNSSASIFNDEGERLIPDFPITWTQPAAGAPIALTRDDADLLVVADVVRNVRVEPGASGRAVPVLDVPQGTLAVRYGEIVAAGEVIDALQTPAPMTATGPSHFYWVDEGVGALWDHVTRSVLVNEQTGAVQVQVMNSPPVRNSAELFTVGDVYGTRENWVYPEVDDDELQVTALRAAQVGAVARSPGAPVDGEGHFALVVNGGARSKPLVGIPFTDIEFFEDGGIRDLAALFMNTSATAMNAWFRAHGYTTTAVGTAGEGSVPFSGDGFQQVTDALTAIVDNPDCRTITVYFVGHGPWKRQGDGFVGVGEIRINDAKYPWSKFLEATVSDNGKSKVFNLILESCFSGSWLFDADGNPRRAGLLTRPNVAFIATSSDRTHNAFGDIDNAVRGGSPLFPNLVDFADFYIKSLPDPNGQDDGPGFPDDSGCEWTSGFVEALTELQDNAVLRAHIRSTATRLAEANPGLTYQSLLYSLAAEKAELLDWAAINGLHQPLTNRTLTDPTQPGGGRPDYPASIGRPAAPIVSLAPSVTEVSPTVGSAAGGDTVVLTGEALWDATSVSFGGQPATIVSVDSDTQITVRTRALDPGVYTVEVVTPEGRGGSATTIYRVTDAPVIAAVSPNVGDPAGGTQVTITGTNLRQATAVRFGGEAAQFTVNDDGSLTVTTPPADAEGAVDVEVVTPDGTGIRQNGFTYQTGPQVGSLTPTAAPLGGGISVLASGANLGGITSVLVAGVALDAGSFSVTATSVTFTAPAQAAVGPVAVLFETADGQRATATLTYVAVLVYQGNFIPLTQVGIASADACGALHWHALRGG